MDKSRQAYDRLVPALKRFIFKKGWAQLNLLQQRAIDPIMDKRGDVIISASTASGKTEAAFLPALSAVASDLKPGLRILYVSPLKALINDQFRRLEEMAQDLKLKITPWHGDVSSDKKKNQLAAPSGVVLITPESLESMLMNHPKWLQAAAAHLDYIIIDEFHAFIGTVRGYQLQSQLHRIENLAGRHIIRVALSATFSDLKGVQPHLRPLREQVPCVMINADNQQGDELAVQVRSYLISDYDHQRDETEEKAAQMDLKAGKIAKDIFRLLRGSTNLVFTNSRSATEALAMQLRRLCQENHVPQEFFPHHGSLSRELREALEHRLQEGRLPTTAICTTTLELGIDISNVQSIGQIDPPLSVASLRQRLGRSGRRDHAAVLRIFTTELESNPKQLRSQLCEDTFTAAAMINLLLKRWYEPPLQIEYAFSTLVQQTLSVIAAYGSAGAKQLWDLLCRTGPFSLTTPKQYAQLLHSLADNDLIVQLNDGTLTLGLNGERLVSDWNFYAAFKTPDEYIIEHEGRHIGTVPLLQPLSEDDTFLFAGHGWKVCFVNDVTHIIGVKSYNQLAAPLPLMGSGGLIHDEVRAEILRLYKGNEVPAFLNRQARECFLRGQAAFKSLNLDRRHLVESPEGIAIFPWRGDRIMRTIILLLKKELIRTYQYSSHIEFLGCSHDTLKAATANILRQRDLDPEILVQKVGNLAIEKHDRYLNKALLRRSYAHKALDLQGAIQFFQLLAKEL